MKSSEDRKKDILRNLRKSDVGGFLSIAQALTQLNAIDKKVDKEICICAAIICEDGTIIRGHRHGDCFKATEKMIGRGFGSQGFITSKNRYVTRKEGAELHKDMISVWTNKPIKDPLCSEDLYQPTKSSKEKRIG